MSLREKLSEQLKTAMYAKDELTTSTLRLIISAMKDKDIAARTADSREGISDEQILALMQTMVKQRNESIKMYEQGGRPELAAREAGEIGIIEKFMPKQFSESETADAVTQAIAAIGATSIKDMGKVMAELKSKYTGQMDFAKAGVLVKDGLK
jgi:hypothetical protein